MAEGRPVRQRRFGTLAKVAVVLLIAITALGVASYRSFPSLYDARYVGSTRCGSCHTDVYARWKTSPHARMTSEAGPGTVFGNFDGGTWTLPRELARAREDVEPVARMYHEGDAYYMALRHPKDPKQFVPFKIDYAIGFQYRQTYLHREPGGVLRRLPLEWSFQKQAYFPYWNFQENTPPALDDLWAQMTSLNSAWNLFCARCHTTHLVIKEKDKNHTRAVTEWSENGIACEACHGPGSAHSDYFAANYPNRIAAWFNSKVRHQPVAFIANGPKLTKGQDLSVCGRCHGPDIQMQHTEVYREYEPGYSRSGKVNDLSGHFKEMPLEPNRSVATVECWADGRPKGIAMVFRSFIESRCYDHAEVRCYDCHDPHANKQPRRPGLLVAGAESDAYCLRCHPRIAADVAGHTHHTTGTQGSFCYDCHMPRHIQNLASGENRPVRTHKMSDIPDPAAAVRLGLRGAPNACNDCHADRTPQWAVEQIGRWRKR